MKEFNTTAACIPSKHYMVDITERVQEIKKLIEAEKYLTIHCARQYGKTTTIGALCKVLEKEYIVISLDFQDMSEGVFRTEGSFVQGMARIICDAADFAGLPLPDQYYQEFAAFSNRDEDKVKMDELFRVFLKWFREDENQFILIIDEVDSAANNQVFLDFLAQLRSLYIKRERYPGFKTFKSVILAGVTDIRYLKTKIRSEDQHKVNSPWNIAADFTVDMSLSEVGIRHMLDEYESDHRTGMDTEAVAESIRAYTEGYPFLVSRICERIDKELCAQLGPNAAWSGRGIDEAVKLILAENNTLFQSITGKLNNYPSLKKALRSILMEGTNLAFTPQQDEIMQMRMYGLIRNDHNSVKVANRIFETMLYNLFLSEEEMKNNDFSWQGQLAKNQFVTEGKLNMRRILEHFITTYTDIYGPLQDRFKEKDGRESFLLYLKPIINGTGNYYIEAQTRNQTRTDIVVDYLGQQYVIELKIWRGDRYNAGGERQISEYLDYFHLTTGYMLSFNFNQKKEPGVKRVTIGDKTLYEGTV